MDAKELEQLLWNFAHGVRMVTHSDSHTTDAAAAYEQLSAAIRELVIALTAEKR